MNREGSLNDHQCPPVSVKPVSCASSTGARRPCHLGRGSPSSAWGASAPPVHGRPGSDHHSQQRGRSGNSCGNPHCTHERRAVGRVCPRGRRESVRNDQWSATGNQRCHPECERHPNAPSRTGPQSDCWFRDRVAARMGAWYSTVSGWINVRNLLFSRQTLPPIWARPSQRRTGRVTGSDSCRMSGGRTRPAPRPTTIRTRHRQSPAKVYPQSFDCNIGGATKPSWLVLGNNPGDLEYVSRHSIQVSHDPSGTNVHKGVHAAFRAPNRRADLLQLLTRGTAHSYSRRSSDDSRLGASNSRAVLPNRLICQRRSETRSRRPSSTGC